MSTSIFKKCQVSYRLYADNMQAYVGVLVSDLLQDCISDASS